MTYQTVCRKHGVLYNQAVGCAICTSVSLEISLKEKIRAKKMKEEKMSTLRFIVRDGKKILQQSSDFLLGAIEFRDVPCVDEEPDHRTHSYSWKEEPKKPEELKFEYDGKGSLIVMDESTYSARILERKLNKKKWSIVATEVLLEDSAVSPVKTPITREQLAKAWDGRVLPYLESQGLNSKYYLLAFKNFANALGFKD